jgi:quinol monooxygenase YgiN
VADRGLGLAVFARMAAHPGQREQLLAALQPFIASGHAEPGTVAYVVHESTDDADSLWFYARFADQAALEAHQANEAALTEAGEEVAKHLAGPPQVEYGTVRSDQDAPA